MRKLVAVTFPLTLSLSLAGEGTQEQPPHTNANHCTLRHCHNPLVFPRIKEAGICAASFQLTVLVWKSKKNGPVLTLDTDEAD
jgi:hypothetical protein